MRFLKNSFVLSLIFCLIICPVLAEIFVRIRISQKYGWQQGSISELYKTDDDIGLRILKPNLDVKGSKTHIKINSYGYRGRELNQKKTKRTIRIAALGASTTFCAEVSNNESTWLEIVRNRLATEFPSYDFEVINGAVPGYDIGSSLKNLRHRILPLEPDILIVYHATNDISYESRKVAMSRGIVKESETFYSSFFVSFLSKHSRFFDLLYKNIAIYVLKQRAYDLNKLTELPENFVLPFNTVLDSIRHECQKLGVPMVVFTFSTKFRRDQPIEQRLHNMNTSLYYMPWMAPDTLFEAFDLFNKEMVLFSKRHKNVYVDTLHNSIPGNDEHFVDSVHFTNKGCRAMAARVFNALIREGLVQKVMGNRSRNDIGIAK